MLSRVTIEGINFPKLYIAENMNDVRIAKDNGLPFVRWTQGNDALVKAILLPTLKKMFPDIKWNKLFNIKPFKTKITIYEHCDEKVEPDYTVEPEFDEEESEFDEEDEQQDTDLFNLDLDDEICEEESDITTGTRLFDNRGDVVVEKKLSIEQYAGDLSAYVNIEVIQSLHLMPQFIGDILDCVRVNLVSANKWSEGYNKKLGATVGNFNRSSQLPNLIILDVSASIPRGISATMLALIDTLRTQCNAELIITSTCSKYYGLNDKLPTPQELRDTFGYGNESGMFIDILNTRVAGRHFGHVFSFGDYDTPSYGWLRCENTKIEKVHHFHTTELDSTGYAKWCKMVDPNVQEEFDNDWCSVIRR